MSDNEQASKASALPHVGIIAAIAAVVVLAVVFFPSDDEQPVPVPAPVVEEIKPEPVPEPIIEAQEIIREPVIEEQIAIEEIAIPEPVQEAEIIETQEPIVVEEVIEVEEVVEEPSKDISDGTIKQGILSLSASNMLGHLLVNDDLLNRFVVFTDNLAREELADNHQLLAQPQNKFRVYQQAGKEWIDAASYRRYSVYSQALESIDAKGLVELYNYYKPEVQQIYNEISMGTDFDDTLLIAIDHVLDTPEIPVPVAVESESVMYQYADRQLENLTAPQKMLLRTGPENMRTIKAKLREIAQYIR